MSRIRDHQRNDEPAGKPPLEGALGELVELEEQIEAQVAQAKLEAEAIVETARRDALRVGDERGSSLDEAVSALRSTIERDRDTVLRGITDRAEAEAELYRRVDDATLSRLSRWVAARVSGGVGSS